MIRHALRILQLPTVLPVNRDTGRPECVTANLSVNPGRLRPAADHIERRKAAHGFVFQFSRAASGFTPE